MLRQHQVPLLLVPSEQQQTWTIYNVLEDNLLELKLSFSHDKRFSGSSQGWLVVVNEDYTISLHRPYFISKGDNDANTSVHLPCLFPPEVFDDEEDDPPLDGRVDDRLDARFNDPQSEYYIGERGYDYHVSKALITADPLTDPNDSTIIVIYGGLLELACFRYGNDTTWAKIADGFRGFEDMVLYKNQLYAIDTCTRLISFDPCNGTIKWVEPTIKSWYAYLTKRYLLESCGELLLLVRCINLSPDASERWTGMFKVLKLDAGGAEWIEVEGLGDVALFVGDNSTISVTASNFNGCQRNCIYFTHDEIGLRTRTNRSCDLGVYSLENKSCNLCYNLNPTTFHRMFRRPPIWIVPLPNGC